MKKIKILCINVDRSDEIISVDRSDWIISVDRSDEIINVNRSDEIISVDQRCWLHNWSEDVYYRSNKLQNSVSHLTLSFSFTSNFIFQFQI